MKPKQVDFKAAKASDIPLNGKQLDLLVLICDVGGGGAIVYGRGPTETVEALKARGLVVALASVPVIVLGKIEHRPKWGITEKGKLLVG
jgi:hypothetical protein